MRREATMIKSRATIVLPPEAEMTS